MKVIDSPSCVCSELGWESSDVGEMSFEMTLHLCSPGASSRLSPSNLAGLALSLVCVSGWVWVGVDKTCRRSKARIAQFGCPAHRSQTRGCVSVSVCPPWVGLALRFGSHRRYSCSPHLAAFCRKTDVVMTELVFLEGVEIGFRPSPGGNATFIFLHHFVILLLFEIPSRLRGQPFFFPLGKH